MLYNPYPRICINFLGKYGTVLTSRESQQATGAATRTRFSDPLLDWFSVEQSKQKQKNKQGKARNPEVFRVLPKATLNNMLIASWLSWIQVNSTPTMILENRPKYLMFNHSH